MIGECYASFECQLYDDALVDKYNFFIFEVVKAHVAAAPKHPRDAALYRRRRLYGVGEDHQPAFSISTWNAVEASHADAVPHYKVVPPQC